MRTAWKHWWLNWSPWYDALSVAAACRSGQMVAVPENIWQPKLLQIEPECLACCQRNELMTGRETRFPPLIPTHAIFRFSQTQDCCCYRCLALNYVPNSFSCWHCLCPAMGWKHHCWVLGETVSAEDDQWWWVTVGGILPQKQILMKIRWKRCTLSVFEQFYQRQCLLSIFVELLLFYQRSRFEYLKTGKINSATGSNAAI